jgi:1-acyl-sn-glycerol-3-phosphate acyltransferase
VAVAPRPSWLYRLVGDASWPVVKVLFRHRATGVGNVPPSGGLVLAANHWSNFDPWPLAMPVFPRRFFRFMAKAELFWFPLAALPASEAARIATERLRDAVLELERSLE